MLQTSVSRPAMAAALVAMDRAAKRFAAQAVIDGARILVAEPARFARAAADLSPGLPLLGQDDQRRRLLARINSERTRLAEGHWTASRNRLVALRQLYVAHRVLSLWSRAAEAAGAEPFLVAAE